MKKYIKTETGFYQLDNLTKIEFLVEEVEEDISVLVNVKYKTGAVYEEEIGEQFIFEVPVGKNKELKFESKDQEQEHWNKEFRKLANDYRKHLDWTFGKFVESKDSIFDINAVYNIFYADAEENLKNTDSFKIRKKYY